MTSPPRVPETAVRARPRRGRYVRALVLAVLGLVLLLLAAWVACTLGIPAPMVPPAGQAMEGDVPFRFAVVGDSKGNTTVFEEILRRIKADRASLILHTGDIVSRCDPTRFDWVLHELSEQKLPMPLCVAPGNHDAAKNVADPGPRYRLYRRAFGPRQYWFAYANALFVAFDSSAGHCRSEDLRWLDETLLQLRDRYALCFVYMHVPPRDPRPGGASAWIAGGKDFADLVERHRVSAVFAGHLHGYFEDVVAGVPLFITGGAGADLLRSDDCHHYLLCTVTPHGSFKLQKTAVGQRLDWDHLECALRVLTHVPLTD